MCAGALCRASPIVSLFVRRGWDFFLLIVSVNVRWGWEFFLGRLSTFVFWKSPYSFWKNVRRRRSSFFWKFWHIHFLEEVRVLFFVEAHIHFGRTACASCIVSLNVRRVWEISFFLFFERLSTFLGRMACASPIVSLGLCPHWGKPLEPLPPPLWLPLLFGGLTRRVYLVQS